MRWYGLCLVLFSLVPFKVWGGTGAGNEYEHLIKRDFDFHLAMPPSWSCEGCEEAHMARRGSEIEQTWLLEAPEKTTHLSVVFITGFPARSMDELLNEIRARHPEVEWNELERGAFVGFTSSPQGDRANAAMEYYLVERGQVIRIEWQKDGSLPVRAYELDNIKRSIDRASAPVQVIEIRTEQAVYRVGDEACFLVEVDDLKAGFEQSSLSSFEIAGAPSHWSFKRIEWVAKSNWFRVCFKVTSAFDKDGLTVRKLEISSDDRSVNCQARDDVPWVMECRNEWGDGEPHMVKPRVGTVENPAPDREGPEILGLSLDEKTLRLNLAAQDATGFGVGRIEGTFGYVYVYPDHLSGETELTLADVAHGGWNTVRSVVLFDANGMPTLLRIPDDERSKVDGGTYELVRADGTTVPTDIPVITFLHARVR